MTYFISFVIFSNPFFQLTTRDDFLIIFCLKSPHNFFLNKVVIPHIYEFLICFFMILSLTYYDTWLRHHSTMNDFSSFCYDIY